MAHEYPHISPTGECMCICTNCIDEDDYCTCDCCNGNCEAYHE